MCGRFSLTATPEKLKDLFPLLDFPDWNPRYNIAPTQGVIVVRAEEKTGNQHADILRWGLIPSWAEDVKIGYKLINARSDGVAAKPSFRSAFKHRRCLILADGFYEWKKQGSAKRPYLIHRKDGQPFAFAGLWEHWEKEQPGIDSCTIITTDANPTIAPLHNRMPVVLPRALYSRWLDPRPKDPGALTELLQPYPGDDLELTPVSTVVNNTRNEGPACWERIAE